MPLVSSCQRPGARVFIFLLLNWILEIGVAECWPFPFCVVHDGIELVYVLVRAEVVEILDGVLLTSGGVF